jgi:hypothetical protein
MSVFALHEKVSFFQILRRIYPFSSINSGATHISDAYYSYDPHYWRYFRTVSQLDLAICDRISISCVQLKLEDILLSYDSDLLLHCPHLFDALL